MVGHDSEFTTVSTIHIDKIGGSYHGWWIRGLLVCGHNTVLD